MPDPIMRKPRIADAQAISDIINVFAAEKVMLPRTVDRICEGLRDFIITVDDGQVVGCCALQLWSDLAEIRSLAVKESHWRKGLGAGLVRQSLDEARDLGVEQVFTLTYQPEFFEKLGFERVSKDRFPQKIWADCANCSKFPNCDEVALAINLAP
jgi:amino-acid N-acetyltransferase